ncbi:MAG TPA: hypothetical protein DCL72_14515 [Rhizobiales bacterium]|jgi:hypothetical protein|nr:hypothetical protein [Hyphomicrobiales bacterium]HAN63318.1 hypothetical protein [Hyphomicrobiales bacterium]HBH42117.1 hypothetical protein [Hyphomicrobiales bacterium]HBR26969.1 hypothetical protein [Hyphomicrobiales bacterium]HCL62898.1 hypothetical protein [Hyphomicrobiales bacterium]
MARNQYFVVLHEGEWKIKHGEEYSARYRTQTEAIQDAFATARRASKQGQDADVLIQEEDLRSGHPFYRHVRAPGRAS